MKKFETVRITDEIAKHILIYSVLLVAFFPFLWMILASLQTQGDIMNAYKGLFEFTPRVKNYVAVFTQYNFIKPIINSFIVAFVSTFMALVLGLPAAYSIARYKFRKLSLVILLVRMIPSITFLVPWYTLFTTLRMTDTFTSLFLSHMLVSLPFIVWIMVPFFDSMPHSLEEAAWIDGCSKFSTFFRIVLVLSRPGILTAYLLSFIFSWNNFMFSLVLSGSRTITLPIAIFSFVSYASVDWGGLMAAAVVITTPIIVLSIFLQKYIIGGLTAGAVKG